MDSVVSAPVASGDFAAMPRTSLPMARCQATARPRARQTQARCRAVQPPKPSTGRARRRFAFLRRHARALDDRLTGGATKFARVERLAYDAAEAVPGLVPTRAEVAAEAELRQADKDGCEIDQGILFKQFWPTRCGLHLCHAMLLPREESAGAGRVPARRKLDLGSAKVERRARPPCAWPTSASSTPKTTRPARHEIAVDAASWIREPGRRAARRSRARRQVCRPPHLQAGITLIHIYNGRSRICGRSANWASSTICCAATRSPGVARRGGGHPTRSRRSRRSTRSRSAAAVSLLATDFNISGPNAYLTLPGAQGRHHPSMAILRLSDSSGTVSPARRSCTSAASTAIPRRAA